MNKEMRKTIDKLVDEIHTFLYQHEGDWDQTAADIAGEERDKFDNMSEGLQQSENGQRIEEAADALDEAQSAIEEAFSALREALTKLEEARDG